MPNVKEKENEMQKIEKVKEFILANESYFEIDKMDFRRSRNLSTGNLWYERLGRAWGEARANVTHNPIQPIVDSTCNSFLRNPFVFDGLPDKVSQKINKTLFKCLREVCNDGLAYFYIYHDDERNLHFENLDNMHVIYSREECVAIRKKTVPRGQTPARTEVWVNIETLNVQKNEEVYLTHFRVKNGKCHITKIIGDKIEAEQVLDIPCLPVIQIKGKSSRINYDTHYRGYYYALQDLIAVLCANWSVSAERIISRDPVMLPAESLGDSNFIEQWKSNEPRNFYTYQSFEIDNSNGIEKLIPLNPPSPAPNTTDIQKLESTRASIYEAIDRTVGSQFASENVGNETATAVLLRNQNKEDALSELLWNLNQATQKIVFCLQKYILFLTGEQIQITVKDKFTESIKNANAVNLLLSISQMPVRVQLAIMQEYDAPQSIINELQLLAQQEQQQQAANADVTALQQQLEFAMQTNAMQQERFNLQMAEANMRAENERMKMQVEIEKYKNDYLLKIAKLELENEKQEVELAIKTNEQVVKTAEALAT